MKHGNIVWYEIPAKDLSRAIHFYSQLLNTSIEKRKVYQTESGIIKKNVTGIGGVIVQKPEWVGRGTVLFLYVNVLSDAIDTALSCGGKLIIPKTLLRQMDEQGNTILAENLIDNQIGYYAELLDSEGNRVSLYSHY